MAIKKLFCILFLSVFAKLPVAIANTPIPTENEITFELANAKNNPVTTDNSKLIKNLENTLYYLQQKSKQEQDYLQLEKQLSTLAADSITIQKEINSLQNNLASDFLLAYNSLSINELEKQLINLQQELQNSQTLITGLNTTINNNKHLVENNQKLINSNNEKIQQNQRWKFDSQTSKSLKDKFNAEIAFLTANNKFNLLLNQHSDDLNQLNILKRDKAILEQQLLQKQLTGLQTLLNTRRLAESTELAQQAEKQSERTTSNPVIAKQLELNTKLSKYSVEQTQTLNTLSQESLRINNVLDSLTQTQRNIEEQISALQGTLMLSRIINKQLQTLPTDQLTGNLGQNIADLRVTLFDLSRQKDELYNIQESIKKLAETNLTEFSEAEKKALTTILTERKKILEDVVKTLNNQLNTSISIENHQKQVRAISSELQTKLHQQSFWVKSNNPLYSSLWYSNFISLVINEISELSHYIGFENISANLLPALSFLLILLIIYAIIIWKKTKIKQRLNKIAEQIKTKNDSHWLTPEAMMWTLILALPGTLLFIIVYSLLVFLFFSQPLAGWRFGLQLTLYWWFFAAVLALLRPNGIAFRHFGMPQASNKIFQSIIKESIWIIVLLITCSVFTQVEVIGYSNDVIGQIVTIIALALCVFVVRPQLNRAIQEYENARTEDGKKRNIKLFNLLRLVLFFVPLTLIVLIVMGYYYTAVFLIEHLLNSYVIVLFWIFGRYFIYRSLWISSRRMASRRLQDKLQKFKEQSSEDKDDRRSNISKGETIRISTVNEQLTRMVDIIGWVILLGMLYVIWSDLISVAYYLDGFILWEQIETTAQGVQVESVTLLNLMRAFLYILVTYILVRNLKGILEAFLFSRVKFSKGSSHTFTAVTTYSIVTMGAILSFTSLGISWGKIQWIFTALSVGLGFGVREIFGSFVSGTILLFERPIRIGDKVSVGQHTGIISKIQLRSTTLINSDNMEVVLPNQAFVTGNFINWTLNNTITRLQLLVKINYGADLDLVHRLMYQAISEAPKVLAEPSPEINILQFKDYALEHELLVFVGKIRDRTPTMNFLYYRINQLFKENQIRFEFKQLDLAVHAETEDQQAVKFI